MIRAFLDPILAARGCIDSKKAQKYNFSRAIHLGRGREHGVCEANAYLLTAEGEELVLASVDRVVPHEDGLLLEDIFGRRKIINARIRELALVEHKIILERG